MNLPVVRVGEADLRRVSARMPALGWPHLRPPRWRKAKGKAVQWVSMEPEGPADGTPEHGAALIADGPDDVELPTSQADSAEPRPHIPQTLMFGLAGLVVMAALSSWLGYRWYETHQAQQRHQLFLDAGRQAAINLTSINYTEVDVDLQRITDSATGSFRDDFRQRAPSFADFVRQIKSVSEGSVTAAGVESEHGDEAQVMAAVTVKSSSTAEPDSPLRYWRMRIGLQKIGEVVKVANVEFVQ